MKGKKNYLRMLSYDNFHLHDSNNEKIQKSTNYLRNKARERKVQKIIVITSKYLRLIFIIK